MITEMVRKALLAGIGAQEKMREMLDDLVKKGELSQSQAGKIVKEWSETAEKSTAEVNRYISEMVEKTLQRMNLPSKQELERLDRKVQSLSIRMKRLEARTGELEEETAEIKEEEEV